MQLTDIEQAMREFVAESPLNTVADLALPFRIYDAPLIGVASAKDTLFNELKEPGAVGPHHMSPVEWINDAGAVVAYFLPFTHAVRAANRARGLPAMEWLYARIEGEMLNNALRKYLVRFFNEAGHKALAPALDTRFIMEKFSSNWSERHVAYVAGLGTFGLHAALITQRGTAGRFGSVIVNLDLDPTPRTYTQRDEFCTKCGACIPRCPVGAVHGQGKEHGPCLDYLNETLERFRPRYGCGKCQTAVPCEAGIPKK
jgi:epoxyqueuosine reductase QueG